MKSFYQVSIITFTFSVITVSPLNFTQDRSLADTNPVIYIPGIMGSPLYDDINNDNELTLDEKAWFGPQFITHCLWLKQNGIDPDGNYNIKVAPLRNDINNTLRDELISVPMDLFKGFFDNLEAIGYMLDDYDDIHSEGENLFCFTYDWRKDNVINAELLSVFIDSVLAWTGSDKVNLVGHSMGGIVSKTCISLFDKTRIAKMVFIGTPHLGAPEVLTVMLKGRLFEWLYFYIAEITVRSLARNLPACYQLIPSPAYFNLDMNNGISTDVEIYSECFQLPNGSYTSYPELIDYLHEYISSFGENLNDVLLDESEYFKESIDTIEFGDIEVYNIVGHNQWTIGKNKVTIGPPPLNWVSVDYFKNLNGDFTVPVRSAELINNAIFENTYYIPDVIHSDLPGSQQTLEILLGVFSDPPVTSFPQYANPPQSYKNITTSDVRETGSSNGFFLSQNYPNPFNPVTKIRWYSASGTRQSLKIYDLLGNEIATLVDEYRPPGEYEIEWNAGRLTSGVYLYKLRSGDFIETKKMILLR